MSNIQGIVYLELCHRNTPRRGTDSTGKVVWTWASDAFGSSAPNEDPDGDGIKTTINLRFPGQYFDAESGLHYNWHRYYDPQVGRYTQPDPIGVEGGVNPYAYVFGNPLGYSDAEGLQAVPFPPPPIPGAINPSTDAQNQLAQRLTEALRRSFPSKTYQTYTRYNPKTGQCYSGRTSGYEDPITNIRRRAAGQSLLNSEGFLAPVLDRSSTSYYAIRGREQQLIDVNGRARSVGGTSRNQINGISPINPAGPLLYIPAAIAEFGEPEPSGSCSCK